MEGHPPILRTPKRPSPNRSAVKIWTISVRSRNNNIFTSVYHVIQPSVEWCIFTLEVFIIGIMRIYWRCVVLTVTQFYFFEIMTRWLWKNADTTYFFSRTALSLRQRKTSNKINMKQSHISQYNYNLKLCRFQTFYSTLSWRRNLTHRNQSIDLHSKLMDWFLYYRAIRHERVNSFP